MVFSIEKTLSSFPINTKFKQVCVVVCQKTFGLMHTAC